MRRKQEGKWEVGYQRKSNTGSYCNAFAGTYKYQETENQILWFGIGSSIFHVQVYPILHAGKNSHVPHPPPLSLLICQCLERYLLLLIAMALLWMIHAVDHCEDRALCGNVIKVAANFGQISSAFKDTRECEHSAFNLKKL